MKIHIHFPLHPSFCVQEEFTLARCHYILDDKFSRIAVAESLIKLTVEDVIVESRYVRMRPGVQFKRHFELAQNWAKFWGQLQY